MNNSSAVIFGATHDQYGHRTLILILRLLLHIHIRQEFPPVVNGRAIKLCDHYSASYMKDEEKPVFFFRPWIMGRKLWNLQDVVVVAVYIYFSEIRLTMYTLPRHILSTVYTHRQHDVMASDGDSSFRRPFVYFMFFTFFDDWKLITTLIIIIILS